MWTYATGDSIISSPALGADSSIIFGSIDGYLYKLTSTGELAWKFQTGGKIVSSPVIGENGNVIFGSLDSTLYSLSVDGNENWRYKAGSAVIGSPSLGQDGVIYFGCEDGTFNAVSFSGALNWYLQTNGPVVSPPLVTTSGLIYVGSTDGNVYVMQISENLGLNKISSANYEWHTFKGNNQRTGFQGTSVTAVKKSDDLLPQKFSLYQNYPNPFNPITKIKFALPKAGRVALDVYNMLGQRVASLINREMNAGYHEVQFDGARLSSGVYFYSIQTENFRDIKKMILLK